MPEIMTTRETAQYWKLHEITVCKYAAQGKIPAIRIGRVWRFEREAIDKWISRDQKKVGKKAKKVSPGEPSPNIIKKSRKGLKSAERKKDTEFEDDTRRSIVYKLRKKDKTKKERKGVYEKT
jgi:excisionase family DNA binding protein